MEYHQVIILKNGIECCLRNGMESDGQAVLDNFNLTHSETDYLLTYPDENSFDVIQESHFLKEKSESKNEIEPRLYKGVILTAMAVLVLMRRAVPMPWNNRKMLKTKKLGEKKSPIRVMKQMMKPRVSILRSPKRSLSRPPMAPKYPWE